MCRMLLVIRCLVRDSRRAARARRKSLSQLVRDCLEQLAARDDPRRDIEEIRRLSAEGKRPISRLAFQPGRAPWPQLAGTT
jgi:hypothetical protein